MSDPKEFMRSEESANLGPVYQADSVFDDPYLQPVEGGYFKCTLCSSVLPGPHHVTMHLEGRLHKRNIGNKATHSDCPSYLSQYGSQFFDGETELSFGVVGKEQAPAHWAEDMKCELCEASILSFDTWLMHFVGKKHQKAKRNVSNRLFWQCLCADFPYYYEHVSGMWQSTPPKHGHSLKGGSVIVVPALV